MGQTLPGRAWTPRHAAGTITSESDRGLSHCRSGKSRTATASVLRGKRKSRKKPTIWESETVSADRVAAINPLISGKEKTHKHKQICGIVPGLGGCQIFVYVFFRVIPYGGEEKHINKVPPKIPGQSRETFVYVFFSLCVFFVPKVLLGKRKSRKANNLGVRDSVGKQGRGNQPPNSFEPISGKGMRRSTFSEKLFFVKRGGRHSVNEGVGKYFYRKGDSVKRSGPFSEPPDSEN